jgi:hypothetical protein
MNQMTRRGPTADDLDQYEEIAIATAQSDMESVIAQSGLQRTDIAEIMGRPKSFISKIMNGGHNLTIRTMARLFASCGFELRFGRTAVVQRWGHITLSVEPSNAVPAAPSGARVGATVGVSTQTPEEAPLAALAA